MSQSDPRFKQSDKPRLYREVATRLKARPRSVSELLGELLTECEWEVPPTVSCIETNLRRWRGGGAFYSTTGGAKQPYVWHAARNAMSKHMIQACLGEMRDGLLPDETSGEPVPRLAVVADVPNLPTRPEPEAELLPALDRLARMVESLPDELWQASMTPRGVLITYDQYHRVLGLLGAITSAHEVA